MTTRCMARRAADGGELIEAWALYRQISADSGAASGALRSRLRARSDGKTRTRRRSLPSHRPSRRRLSRRRTSARAHHPLGPRSSEGIECPDDRPLRVARAHRPRRDGQRLSGRDPMINRIVALKGDRPFDRSSITDGPATSTRKSFLREAAIAGQLEPPEHRDDLRRRRVRRARVHRDGVRTRPPLERVRNAPNVCCRSIRGAGSARAERRTRSITRTRRNVVHRDIKPANIMYDSLSNNLKITDFGIAKLIDVNRTRTGIVLGTPAFMSPEQLEGKNVNGHTDLFALGVSLYQLLTGQLPFRGASMTNLMFVIANEPHQSVTSLRPELPSMARRDASTGRWRKTRPTDSNRPPRWPAAPAARGLSLIRQAAPQHA